MLFSFGSIGYYRRPHNGLCGAWTTFESQSFTGITLGHTNMANRMLLRNPTLSRFCVSAGYILDILCFVADPFPTLVYDGGLHLRLFTDPESSASEPYPPGSAVYYRLNPQGDIAESLINSVPTELHDFYTVDLLDGASVTAAFGDLISPDEALNPDFSHLPYSNLDGDPLAPSFPLGWWLLAPRPPWPLLALLSIDLLTLTQIWIGSLPVAILLAKLVSISKASSISLMLGVKGFMRECSCSPAGTPSLPHGPPTTATLVGNGHHVSASTRSTTSLPFLSGLRSFPHLP